MTLRATRRDLLRYGSLSALAAVTDVKIISAPTLMVIDNKEGILQIGDQVLIQRIPQKVVGIRRITGILACGLDDGLFKGNLAHNG